MRPRLRHLAGLVLVAATLAGCGTTSDHALRTTLDGAGDAARPPRPRRDPGSRPLCTASLRPPATLPAPGAHARRQLHGQDPADGATCVAGVNAGLLNFGYLNPPPGRSRGSRSTS